MFYLRHLQYLTRVTVSVESAGTSTSKISKPNRETRNVDSETTHINTPRPIGKKNWVEQRDVPMGTFTV